MSDANDSADQIVRTIRQLVRCISEHSRYLSREVGLTVPQLFTLKAIGALEEELAGGDVVTVAAVARRVHLSAGTVSRILDRLARAGLISRERSTGDRRRVSLTLTAAGLERYQTLPVPLQERFVERLAELPVAERDRLLASLRTVAELMDATDLDAAPLLAPGAEFKTESDPPPSE